MQEFNKMDSIEHMKIAAFEELKEALKIKRVNDELLEYLASSLTWILHYCQKCGMPLPEQEKIIKLIDRAIEIENKSPLPDESLQLNKRAKTDGDFTEPELADIAI
jgi:hypothetical protein